MRRLVPALMLAVVSPGWLAGCGSENFTLAPTSGRVTVDGQPVAGLRIAFEPIGSSERPAPGPEAIGVTDGEGRFTLSTMSESPRQGAVVGKCRVRIWTLPSNQEDALFDDQNPAYNPVEEIKVLKQRIRSGGRSKTKVNRPTHALPLRYNDNTELSFEVPHGGTDKADFQLSSK
ncbi:MAG: hypothetical protein P4L84_29620 [Isosphaeraceae bacterium]|nr:hypothetical protein [Isosphaeraceae bacterium]